MPLIKFTGFVLNRLDVSHIYKFYTRNKSQQWIHDDFQSSHAESTGYQSITEVEISTTGMSSFLVVAGTMQFDICVPV